MKRKQHSPSRQKKQDPVGGERGELLQSLQENKRELDLAQMGFDQCTDMDLIEFYLYEISALRARYNYLLRRIKGLDTPLPPVSLQPQAPQTGS